MGLDMYLTRKVYVGANYEHNNVKGVINLNSNGKEIKVNLNKVSEIIESVGYWRKANAIHNWFVTNIQEGEDDCKEYYVTIEKLRELKELCKKVIDTKDTSLLPPTSGFFFGGTEIDEWYFKQLQETIDIIDSLDGDSDFYYQASW